MSTETIEDFEATIEQEVDAYTVAITNNDEVARIRSCAHIALIAIAQMTKLGYSPIDTINEASAQLGTGELTDFESTKLPKEKECQN